MSFFTKEEREACRYSQFTEAALYVLGYLGKPHSERTAEGDKKLRRAMRTALEITLEMSDLRKIMVESFRPVSGRTLMLNA